MQEKCRLCEQEAILLESHIIPKFIYSYLKDTSPTGKLREAKNINLRKQDGIKLHWFCQSCENIFSEWEKYFSEKIFYPLQEDKVPIYYNEKFLKFCVSISWRVLKFLLEEDYISDFSSEIKEKIQTALIAWRKLLLNEVDNPGVYEQHFYNFIGEIESKMFALSSNIHRYLQRSIAIDVINWGSKAIIVYSKFPGLLLVGFIHIENRNTFRDTIVHVKRGTLQHQNFSISQQLLNYIQTKANRTDKIKRSLSSKQRKKINEDYKKISMEDVASSGTFQSLKRDIDLSS
ncbi:TPA: hypothetical protein ACF58N_001537 [Legionella pneumophila]